ncbi:hypothetical protein [Aeoliella mucimassa]|uniref:Uncharacterized protein n=1 Tax=Aeoliella mucimassa TaxID=2527972 RepID=A0A518ANB0_9BACT|nr:hypothetical protein [Aeoliella mucimassa]QDU56218.1 hypothetical protein Pan181_24260 [Aeoliella mucimassa]
MNLVLLHRALPASVHRQRRGTALVVALTCLLLISMLVTAMLQAALTSRRQLRTERHARQAMLLLQAGAERAQQQWTLQETYDGETLRIEVPEPTETQTGEVVIARVAADPQTADPPTKGHLTITAKYPLESPHFVQRSLTISLPQSTPSR